MRVVWTEIAHAQLDEAMAFIARDRPETAARWLELILNEAAALSEFPDRGRVVPEVSRDDVRELIVSPYRVIYHRDESVVHVTMLYHVRRKLEPGDID